MATRRERERREYRYASAVEGSKKEETGFGPSGLKIPKEFSLFKFTKPGKYRLRILPYIVGKGNKLADEGFVYFKRSYFVHNKVGVDEKSYCCLRENWGEKCPICEKWMSLDRWGADKDVAQTLSPKKRDIFCVMDLDDKERGIQIFESAFYFGLGEEIKSILDNDETGKYANFFHPVGGMTLLVSVEKNKKYPNAYSITRVDMVEGKDMPTDILEQTPCLDDLLIKPNYKELVKMMDQAAPSDDDIEDDEEDEALNEDDGDSDDDDTDEDAENDDGEEEETPRAKKGKKLPTAKECGLNVGDLVTYQDEEWEIKKISPDGTSLTLETEAGDVKRGVGPEECELVDTAGGDEEEEEEEVPTKSARGAGKKSTTAGAKKPSSDDDEDKDDDDEDEDEDSSPLEEDEDEDEDEDEEPVAKKKGRGRR